MKRKRLQGFTDSGADLYQEVQKYGQDAKDPVLKELFSTLEKNEQKHYDTLGQILEGKKFLNVTATTVREKSMSLEATYDVMSKSEDEGKLMHF